MSVWDDIKSWFDKEDDNPNHIDKQNEMMDYLKQMDDKYRDEQDKLYDIGMDYVIPTEPTWKEPGDYDDRSDKEITLVVKDSIEDQYNTDKEKLENEYDQKIGKKNNVAAAEKDEYEGALASIEKAAKQAKEREVNSAVERGIANSSILQSAINEKDYEARTIKDNAAKGYADNINKINEELKYLESAKSLALKSHDNKSLENIKSKIKSMKKERDSFNEKIDASKDKLDKQKLDYNDRVAKAKNDYVTKQDKIARETEAYENRYGYSGAKKTEYDKRLNLALNFYNGLPKKEAIKMIENNSDLAGYLGQKLNELVRTTHARTK